MKSPAEPTRIETLSAALAANGYDDVTQLLRENRNAMPPTVFGGIALWLKLSGSVVLEAFPVFPSPGRIAMAATNKEHWLDLPRCNEFDLAADAIVLAPSAVVPELRKQIKLATESFTPLHFGRPIIHKNQFHAWDGTMTTILEARQCVDTTFDRSGCSCWILGSGERHDASEFNSRMNSLERQIEVTCRDFAQKHRPDPLKPWEPED